MKRFVRIISMALIVLIIASMMTATAFAADNGARYELPFDVNAQSYILVSLDTGEIIFEKNSRQAYIPASLTKLLTAYTVYKYVDDLDNTMIEAPNYIYDELYGMNSSTADIRQHEVLSARQLMYAMLLPSANEAASILADYVGRGNISNFCMMMNSEAKKLGCVNTHFTNAHGLFFDDHYTCAYDMYLIAKALYEIPGFMDIVTTNTYQMPANLKHAQPYDIYSTVKMQSRTSPYYRSYVRGMKTGSLPEIGHNFVTVCEQNGEHYILVVIGANTSSDGCAAFVTAAAIMDYFFDNYSLANANTSEYATCDIKLKYSKQSDTLLLYADTPVYSVLPNTADDTSFQKVYNLPDYVSAPVKNGDVIGTVDYYLAGQLIGTSQLLSHSDYSRSIFLFIIGKLIEAWSSLYFKVVVVLVLILIGIYVRYMYFQNKKAEKMNKVRRRR